MNKNIDIIYCYRNRDLQRVKNSLDSLALQSVKDFNVIFIDYGSDDVIAKQVKDLCGKYYFCFYVYIDAQGKMWNRADALNCGFYFSKSDFVFTSDIDMLFDPNFVQYISEGLDINTAKFFSVGYLSESDTQKVNVNKLSKLKYSKSKDFALGMVLLSRKMVFEINGYNSFYAIWGQEDNDIKYRIERAGFESIFMNEKIYLLHQYHPISNSDSNSVPEGWLQFIKDYHESFTLDKKTILGIDSVADSFGRPAKVIFNKSTTFKELGYRKLFTRYQLINGILNLFSGESLSYNLNPIINVNSSSNILKLENILNKTFTLVKLPLEVKSIYREQYIDKNEIKNEIYFVIKTLEQYIKDYYLYLGDQSIKLVIVRK